MLNNDVFFICIIVMYYKLNDCGFQHYICFDVRASIIIEDKWSYLNTQLEPLFVLSINWLNVKLKGWLMCAIQYFCLIFFSMIFKRIWTGIKISLLFLKYSIANEKLLEVGGAAMHNINRKKGHTWTLTYHKPTFTEYNCRYSNME